VASYPSFILIDPQGKMVFRDSGLTGFANLQKLVPQLLGL
jgi:hypothetical protein